MVENSFEYNALWAVLAAVLWSFTARGVRRLPDRRTAGAVRWRLHCQLALATAAVAAVAVRVAAAAVLADTHGLTAAWDYLVLGCLPVVVASCAATAVTVPAAVRTLRSEGIAGPGNRTRPLTPADRSRLADPRLAVPAQAAALAALLGAALTLHPPAPPYPPYTVLLWTVLLLGTAAGVLRARRRRDRLGTPGRWPLPRRRRWLRSAATTVAATLTVAAALTGAAQSSRLPADMVMTHGHEYDLGGGAAPGAAPARSVTDLTGPPAGRPDRRFTLTATEQTLSLASGETVDALAFNGTLPGPELRVRVGDLVEVVLVNEDVERGVTLHWHGVDVPNAEDGVAGLTQDAVPPGGRHVYRFRPDRAGTFWYHSHQQSDPAVRRGLFGALVVEEKEQPGVDRTVVAHSWPVAQASGRREGGGPHGGPPRRTAFGDDTGEQQLAVAAGTPVRLRLVNADNCPRTFALDGTSFRVAAIDGNAVNGATELRGRLLRIAGGGRMDVVFRQPADGGVRLSVTADPNVRDLREGCGGDGTYGEEFTPSAALLLGPGKGGSEPAGTARNGVFDPLGYGRPQETPFGPDPRTDRTFTLVFGNSLGFYDGRPQVLWTVNNAVYPEVPTLLVREGDVVRMVFVNRSMDDHPMHLHGHRMLVLSRDGRPATGSPWWTDTLNVAPGERYEVVFRADNPGLWMDHCHNLKHARNGMMLHLAYDGVTSPFHSGSGTGNQPE